MVQISESFHFSRPIHRFNTSKKANLSQLSLVSFCGKILTPLIDNKEVLKIFREEIVPIPRNSGNCEQISNYLVDQLKEEGFEVYQQKEGPGKGNIVASRNVGSNNNAIILQAHMDMVYVTKTSKNKRKDKPPVIPIISGGYLKAKNTSLGADDGIGVALALAVARVKDKLLRNIPLQIVFTVDEETGLLGVKDLDLKHIKGNYLIGLDNGCYNKIITGCAGLADFETTTRVPFCELNKVSDEEHTVISVEISNAKGGHSGLDINKGRINTIVELINLIKELNCDFKILNIKAGEKINTIPANAKIEMAVPLSKAKSVISKLNKALEDIKQTYKKTDAGLSVSVEQKDVLNNEGTLILNPEFQLKLVKLISQQLQVGALEVNKRSPKPITSQNIGYLNVDNSGLKLGIRLRSNSTEQFEKQSRITQKQISALLGRPIYPELVPVWNPSKKGLTALATQAFKEINDKMPILTNTHGTVEGAIFDSVVDEQIGIGPTVKGIHTPDERILLKTLEPTCNFLETLIKRLYKLIKVQKEAA